MLKQFRKTLLLIALLFFGGSVGYFLIEGWDPLDSLYMTVITLSTTGFKEIKPMSSGGKIFTIALIVFGITIFFYALGNLNSVLFETNFFRDRKMDKKLKKLSNHYIICGLGRIGQRIANELATRNEKFVVIEKDSDLIDTLKNLEYTIINDDATEDDSMIKAGIKEAKGLVTVLRSDVDNVFATLSARGLNPKLKIIARAEEESSRKKLLKAGANKVILPYEIGGFRIAQALLKPTVVDYFDELFSRPSFGLQIEEIKIKPGSDLAGKTVAKSLLRNKMNIIIIAIYRHDGELVYNPTSNTKFNEGDTLIVIGESEQLKELEKLT